MIFSSRNYAVGMAHYQIAGGNRALGILVGGYIALGATILGFIVHTTEAPRLPMAMRALAAFLLVVQSFGLLFFGSGRIANCIRVDTMNNMLESHRLMPVSASRVVLSYIFGTTSQLLAVLILNALVLAGVEQAAGVSLEQFITSQMVLGFFAIFVWTFMTMGAFMTRQALPLMVFGCIFGGLASGFLRQFGILPAVSILITPFFGETIYNLMGGGVNLRDIYYIAIPGQLAFAALFFLGACRRYRGSYLTTFNAGMGIALVGIWGLLSLLSIAAWHRVTDQFGWFEQQPGVPAQTVAALVVAALLMVVPLHALATWEGVHGLRFGRRWGAIAAVLAMAALPLLTRIDSFVPLDFARLVSMAVITLHALTLFAVFRFTRGMSGLAAGVLVVVLLVGVWLGPLVVETVRWTIEMGVTGRREEYGVISTLSPLGLLMRAWRTVDGNPPMLPGLIFQGIVAGAAWALGNRRLRVLAMADEPKLLKV